MPRATNTSTTKKQLPFTARLARFLGSNLFLYIVLGWAVFGALWIALFSIYPMAFDEEFHVGLIRMYAEVWNPFSVVQLPQYDAFGSVTTDPSYLFHYLMSFPYRLLDPLLGSEEAVLIVLRLGNVAMFTLGLWLYHKLLREVGLPAAATNVVLAIFVLIPVVPLLAAHINYDNVLMVATPAAFLLAVRIRARLRQNGTLTVWPVSLLLLLLMVTSVVKYAFLPIAAAVFLYVLYEVVRAQRQKHVALYSWWHEVRELRLRAKLLLAGLLLVATFFAAPRYVANIVQYHDVVPDCAAAVSVERCRSYGPWARNYRMANDRAGYETVRGPLHYTATHWAHGMWNRLYFTLAGQTNGYQTKPRLALPAAAAIVLTALGVVLVVAFARTLWRRYPAFTLFAFVGVLYVGAVWLQVYQDYVYTGRPVAINGRYLLPILPALGAIAAAAYMQLFHKIRLAPYQAWFAVAVLLVMLQGGGVFTYMLRSEPHWFWQNSVSQHLTDAARSVVQPLFPFK